ncbi:MAG TPA: alkaline phosphatase family protein [Kofleriaceae bacterium]|nr:alkaline phosphatase family protein [Kofleriaceae bacterium]
MSAVGDVGPERRLLAAARLRLRLSCRLLLFIASACLGDHLARQDHFHGRPPIGAPPAPVIILLAECERVIHPIGVSFCAGGDRVARVSVARIALTLSGASGVLMVADSIERLMVERLVVLDPDKPHVEKFTPAASGAIKVTCDVGAGNCRVAAQLRDASQQVIDSFEGKLRDLKLDATPVIDTNATGHFTLHLLNDGSVQGDGLLRIEFMGRRVGTVIPFATLDHLLGTIVINELNPRIKLHPDHMELVVDERMEEHVPEKLKKIPRDFKVSLFTFHVSELTLGNKLDLEVVPASPKFPGGSLRATITVNKVRVSSGVPLGGADNGKIVIEVGVGVKNQRLSVTDVDVKMDWNAAGVAKIVDLKNFAANKLDKLLTEEIARRTHHLITATSSIKKLLRLDEFTDLRVTTAGIEVKGIGGPATAPTVTGPITAKPLGRMQHLVVVMMENRSFDHMLGDLMATRPRLGTLPQYREDFNGKVHRLRVATTSKVLDDPPHGSGPQKLQAAGKYVQAYVESGLSKNPPDEVLTFQPEANVPFFEFLVDNACVCLDWRAAIPGQTWPNRAYSLSGTSKGELDNGKGGFDFYDMPNICDVLDDNRPDQWRYFRNDVAFLQLYHRWFRDEHHIQRVATFHEECLAGTLRKVTFIEPNISDFGSERGNDDHPPADVKFGQGFLSRIYRSLCAYTKKTGDRDWLLLITYDEHGGFYDSKGVGTKIEDDHDTTRQRGFRVPTFFVSPWLSASVCSAPFDHASIVRTILDQFCSAGTKLGQLARVEAATSFKDVLDFAAGPQWPIPREESIEPPAFDDLPKEFHQPPPASGQESTLATAIDNGTAEVHGDSASARLWREFMEKRRAAIERDNASSARVTGGSGGGGTGGGNE